MSTCTYRRFRNHPALETAIVEGVARRYAGGGSSTRSTRSRSPRAADIGRIGRRIAAGRGDRADRRAAKPRWTARTNADIVVLPGAERPRAAERTNSMNLE